MIEEAGTLAAAVAAAASALLTWVATRLRASIKRTTDAAAGAIDVAKMRSEVDGLLEFRAGLEAEREQRSEKERQALEDEVASLKRKLEQRELTDSSTSKTGMRVS